jgi:hypothetical protein
MITTTTTTTTTNNNNNNNNNERSPRAELRRLLRIFAAAAALTTGACADLDDAAWEDTRGGTANDTFDDEDYPIGRSHGLDDVDPGAWGDAALDLDDSLDGALDLDEASLTDDEGDDEGDAHEEDEEDEEDDGDPEDTLEASF